MSMQALNRANSKALVRASIKLILLLLLLRNQVGYVAMNVAMDIASDDFYREVTVYGHFSHSSGFSFGEQLPFSYSGYSEYDQLYSTGYVYNRQRKG